VAFQIADAHRLQLEIEKLEEALGNPPPLPSDTTDDSPAGTAASAAAVSAVVVGGGYSGVELACNLAERLDKKHKAAASSAYISSSSSSLHPPRPQVMLVHRGPHLLPASSSDSRVRAEKALKRAGVLVRCGTGVKAVEEGSITVVEVSGDGGATNMKEQEGQGELDAESKDERGKEEVVRAGLVVWTAGSRPNSAVSQVFERGYRNQEQDVCQEYEGMASAMMAKEGAKEEDDDESPLSPSPHYQKVMLDANGRLVVDSTLAVCLVNPPPQDGSNNLTKKKEKTISEVFALGDNANVVPSSPSSLSPPPPSSSSSSPFSSFLTPKPVLPATAQVALQASEYCAWNVYASLRPDQKKLAFRYTPLGEMMSLGRTDASVSLPDSLSAPLRALASSSQTAAVNAAGSGDGDGGLGFGGPLGSIARRLVYAARMPTVQQREVALKGLVGGVVQDVQRMGGTKGNKKWDSAGGGAAAAGAGGVLKRWLGKLGGVGDNDRLR
jgi:NADH dehydrogenase FAD-containing subunit